MLNPNAKEYNKCSFLPDISVFYDKKDLLIPFTFKSVEKQRKELKKNLRVPEIGLKNKL
jgi:hypothetical protein